MTPTVVFIHTISGMKGTFDDLANECLPDCATCHISDETLIKRLLASGGLTPAVHKRVCDHIVAAAEYGADYIQLTCSSITPCIKEAAALVSVPVLSIDEPMASIAVTGSRRVGVIATNPASLKPSTELVKSVADAVGQEVEVVSILCEGAYAALLGGDQATHDRIVLEKLKELLGQVDAVCLAQASMARIADLLDDKSKPVYASPKLAMESLGRLMRDSYRC